MRCGWIVRTAKSALARTLVVAIAAFCASPSPSSGQTVEMIRPIPNMGVAVYEERYSAWSSCSNSCGNGLQTRSSTCVLTATNQSVDPGKCGGITTTQACNDLSGCTFDYATTPWAKPASCGPVTSTRSVSCLRSDGTTMDLAACSGAGAVPPSTQTDVDYSTCTYGFETKPWGSPSSFCSVAAVQTREVNCIRSDPALTPVQDSFCGAGKPASSQTITELSGCAYSWQATAFTPFTNVATPPAVGAGWTETCTPTQRRTRTVWCLRSDGTTVSDSMCPAGTKPAPIEEQANWSGCAYEWEAVGNWSPPVPACGATVETQTINCRRSADLSIFNESSCDAATRPSTTRPSTSFTTCSFSWITSSWGAWSNNCSDAASRTRTVQCQRSDGTIVADGSCSAGTRPPASETTGVYSSCSFTWTSGSWSTPSGCGYVTSTRSVACFNQSLGRNFADGYCSAGTRPAASQTDYDIRSCSYTWSAGAWSGWNTGCSDAAVRTRSIQCVRGDGAVVADGSCNAGTRPAASESAGVYSSCSLGWTTGGWSTPAGCGYVTSTRYVACHNYSLGRTFPDGYCSAGSQPAASQTDYDVRSCSYAWTVGGWSDWNSYCSASAYRGRSVQCQRSDGAIVGDGSCPGGKPAVYEYSAQYANCSFGWIASGWSTPAGCGYVTSSRETYCYNHSLGQYFPEGYCSAGTRPGNYQTDYDIRACSYAWNVGGWGGWDSSCSDGATRYRSVFCQRGDGANVGDDARCGGKPATSESGGVYHGCSYGSGYGALAGQGPCVGGTRTDTYYRTCTRSDGRAVDASAYCGSYYIYTYSSCQLPVSQGGGCLGGVPIAQEGQVYCRGRYYPSGCPPYDYSPGTISLAQCEAMGGNCLQTEETWWEENNDTQDGWQGTIYQCYSGSYGHYGWGALDSYQVNGGNVYRSEGRF